MKTAVTVLQELMIKLGQLPNYECISQSGPQHQATFEYSCTAYGVTVTGQARSKKEAKQEAARRMLMQLHSRGISVPPPFASPPSPPPPSPPLPSDDPALEAGPSRGACGTTGAPAVDSRSYVALLKELCEEYRLGEPEYELVSDTGPPHQRRFTMRARLRMHERQATSTTKKAARQLAAEQLYSYLRENLARLTGDFVEEEALARAHEKRSQEKRAAEATLQRVVERCESTPWRHDLGQRLSNYHLDEDRRTLGVQALIATQSSEPEKSLESVCIALGLRVERPNLSTSGLTVFRLTPTSPTLAFAGREPTAAAATALRYLRRTLLVSASSAVC
ncbi:uncharacterized protein LOC126781597 isoform X2 [Nymphalis io]|uniref:uncharacterized protein LOC126781597 isoform X2 n=1 Tax=Inachis io TaxID=171585 RepID=UPI002169F73E|nr:uncharacterized protein LOC126781597 isoform X2 [Nymphalis io]